VRYFGGGTNLNGHGEGIYGLCPSVARVGTDECLMDLMLTESTDPGVRHLAQRLWNYWDELLTLLDHPEVSPANTHMERNLRPAVI